MFIKTVDKKFKGSDSVYTQHRLIESYRTEAGPRQRTIINLGTLTLSKEKWKLLADRIEALAFGSESLFPTNDMEIESLAIHYSQLIIRNKIVNANNDNKLKEEHQQTKDYEEVNINSVATSQVKTIGPEYVGVEMFKLLGLDEKLAALGFNSTEVKLAALSIIGRLVKPKSERGTRHWVRTKSGIDEILGEDWSKLSNNALYRIADKLEEKKTDLEEYLSEKERDLFSLEERIILYDLTNTHMEGRSKGLSRGKRGRSKQKRNDCPLLTLGLVIDEKGYPKRSEIFDGNVSESKTLLEMIEKLGNYGKDKKKTIVMDAGISTEENLEMLREKGYDYICVARNKPLEDAEIEEEADFTTVKADATSKVETKLIKRDNESILYCKSMLKGEKEKSIRTLHQERIEKDLININTSLSKKGGVKQYEKVIERIGRLKEKHSKIARFYTIEVTQKDGKAESMQWQIKDKEKLEKVFSGSYFIRTSRKDLNEQEIWSIYTMLTRVEDSFRCLKSELNLRPVWHKKQSRADGHIFITVLAYHLLNSIQNILKVKKINLRWKSIVQELETHVRVTTSMMTKENKRIHIRNTSIATGFQQEIYSALNLNNKPLNSIRTE